MKLINFSFHIRWSLRDIQLLEESTCTTYRHLLSFFRIKRPNFLIQKLRKLRIPSVSDHLELQPEPELRIFREAGVGAQLHP